MVDLAHEFTGPLNTRLIVAAWLYDLARNGPDAYPYHVLSALSLAFKIMHEETMYDCVLRTAKS